MKHVLWIRIMNTYYEYVLWVRIMNMYYEYVLWIRIMNTCYEARIMNNTCHTFTIGRHGEHVLWVMASTYDESSITIHNTYYEARIMKHVLWIPVMNTYYEARIMNNTCHTFTTRVVKYKYCVSQKQNEANDKNKWYNVLRTFIS